MGKKQGAYIIKNGKKMFVKPTKSNAKLKYEHECGWCGKTFISNRKTAKFCSNSCRVQYHLWAKT